MERRASGRVVVGVCGTLAGLAALRYAVEQARLRGAELVAVRTVRSPSSGLGAQWHDVMRAAMRAEAELIFVDALGGLPPDIPVTFAIQDGLPGPVLTELAASADDLLVIGGSSRRWRGGKVAKHCARRARCAVVIVPEPEMARLGSARRLSKAAAADVEKFLHT